MNLHKTPGLSVDILLPIIKHYEIKHDYELSIEDFDFLVSALQEFTMLAVDKFIAGGAEHNEAKQGTFVYEVDHITEGRKEIIDLWMYATAQLSKHRKK